MKKVVALLWLALVAIPAVAFGQSIDWMTRPLWELDPSMPKEWRQDIARQRRAITHAKWNVCIDVQMVALEESKALELLPQLQSVEQKEVDAAWARLQGMIRKGEATLLAWPMVQTVDGAGGASQTTLEKRYPTNFEPPQVPQTLSGPPPKPGPIRADTVEGLPNAYETRNLEVSLEASPVVLSEGRQLYLDLRVSRVDLIGFQDFGYALSVHNALVPAPQPLFFAARSTLELKLRNGQRQLVAVHKLAKPENFIELHLVRAMVRPAD